MSNVIVSRRYGVWSAGRRVAVVEADDPREALRRYISEVFGGDARDVDWFSPTAASWRGAGFRAEPESDEVKAG